MAVFIDKKELSNEFFEQLRFAQEMGKRHQQAKKQNQICHIFLAELREKDPSQAEQLYLRVAESWKRLSGGMTYEEDRELGRRLSHNHLDDPFVSETILRFMRGEEDPKLQGASVDNISENIKKITSADSFNTECTIYSCIDQSERSRKCFSMAYEALSFAARHMPFCGNNSRINSDLKIDPALINKTTSRSQARCKEKYSVVYFSVMRGIYFNFFSRYIKRAVFNEKTITGNCNELSATAFLYLLKERQADIRVDIFYIENGDHVFLVIGRRWDSKPCDWKTWGPDAVVCDPWARKIYPASEIPSLLEDFKSRDSSYGAILKKFDPVTQSLSRLTSNIYSVQDLHVNWILISEIVKMLQVFHSMPIHHQKESQAGKIIEAIQQLSHFNIESSRSLNSLLAQMQYLLRVPQPGTIRDPFYEALIEAEKTNNLEAFRNTIKDESFPLADAINFGLRAVKKTGNLEFLKIAIDSGGKPTEETFLFASFIGMKTGDFDCLRRVMSIGALVDNNAYTRAVLYARKTDNLDFLRLAIRAGAQPCGREFAFIGGNAIRPKDTPSCLKLYGMSDVLIKQYLEDEALSILWRRGIRRKLGELARGPIVLKEVRAWFVDPEKQALLTHVTELDLSESGLRMIPPEIVHCTQLQRLIFRVNQISFIPDLRALTQLKFLSLFGNRIKNIPDFCLPAQLQSLDLGDNRISEIRGLSLLTQLSHLDLDDNRIVDLSFLKSLTWPIDLSLCGNDGLFCLPDEDLHSSEEVTIDILVKSFDRFKEYKCGSRFSNFIKVISLEMHNDLKIISAFNFLEPENQSLISEEFCQMGDFPDEEFCDELLCSDKPLLCRAVKEVILAKYDGLSEDDKATVHEKIDELAAYDEEWEIIEAPWEWMKEDDEETWERKRALSHVLRLMDAMELAKIPL